MLRGLNSRPLFREIRMAETEETKENSAVPKTVWILGMVSLLMDISSEMIHALLPLFMVQTLNAGAFWIGLTEGGAEAIALFGKVFSGVIADRFKKRKILIFLGYGLGVASKPFFAMADSILAVVGARFADRIGKGLRGAPRDALVADVTPKETLGAAYGVRQSMDAAGAFVGPLLATILLFYFAEDFRTIFWIALIPGLMCLALILFGIHEPADDDKKAVKKKIDLASFSALVKLDSAPWRFVVILGVLFSLARFSNAFIVLRAADTGIANMWVPMVMVGMNLVFSAACYPFGKLADHVSAKKLLAVSLVLLAASDLTFAFVSSVWGTAAGVVLWGLHLASSQGIFSLMVARAAPEHLRASAFGVFNLFSGAALLLAGIGAGTLWDFFGPTGTFAGGAVVALVTLLMLAYKKSNEAVIA